MTGKARPPADPLPAEVRVLAAVAFVVAVGFGVQAPVLPVFARSLGVGGAAIGLLVSSFAVMRIVSASASGRLVNRLGENTMISVGLLVMAVANGAAGLSTDFLQLLVFRSLAGLGSAMYTVSAVSLLIRVTSPDRIGAATGRFQGGFYAGAVVGPAIGGALLVLSERAPFFAYGLAVGVCAAACSLLLGRIRLNRGEPMRTTGDGDSFLVALRHPGYRAALVSNFTLGWAVFGARVSFIPLYMLAIVGTSSVWIGVGLSLSAVVQALGAIGLGRRLDSLPLRITLLVGDLAIVAGLALLWVSPTHLTYLTSMALLGLAVGLLSLGGTRLVGQLVTSGGVLVAGHQSAADAGMVLGPLVLGLMVDHFGFDAGLITTLLMVAVAALVVLRLDGPQPPGVQPRARG